jgi:WD40 repeat protein
MAEVRKVWEKRASAAVEGLAVSIDGALVLARTSDARLQLFAKDGREVWSIPAGAPIAAMDITPPGDHMAAGLASGTVMQIDGAGQVAWRHDAGEPVLDVCLSHNGKYLLAGTAGGSILFFNSLGKLLWTRKAKGAVSAVALSSSANFAAAGSDDGAVAFLDNYTTNMGGKVAWNQPMKGKMRKVAISADGFYIAAAPSDSSLQYMDKLGKLYWSHRIENNISAMDMSSSGDYIFVGAEGGSHPGQVALFHRTEGLLWRYITGQAAVGSAAISSTGAFMAAGSQNDEVFLFHRNQKLAWKTRLDGPVDAVAISPDGMFTVAGTRKGTVYFFDNTPVAQELKPQTQEQAELDVNLFRPMRMAAPAFEEEPEPPVATMGPSPRVEEAVPARARIMEAVVEICLLVVLLLVGGVVYIMYRRDIGLEQGMVILVALLVVMVSLAYIFYAHVVSRPRKKGPSFY